MLVVIAIVAAALARPFSAAAQVERGELRVVITDPSGLPMPASGTLTSEAPQLYRAFTADAAGRFTLQNLPFGVYRLIVERPGFIPYSGVVEIHTAVPRTLRIELSLAAMATDVEVTSAPPLVDASRTGVTFSIGAPQIQEHLPAVPGRRVLDLVDAQPGWLMEANGVLHPRGSEYQTLFVVDGIPMDENRSPAFAPDLQEGDLQTLTVLTGNFPAEYGRKLGGVVEVTSGHDLQRGFHGSADGGGGSFGTGTASFTGAFGWARRALTVGGSAARTNRYLDPPSLDHLTNDGTLGGVTASYEDRPSDRDRIRLMWHRRGTRFHVPNDPLQEAAGQRQQRTGREDLAQASWTRVLGSRLVLNARGVGERIGATLDSNAASTPIVVSQDRSIARGYANASIAADLRRHQVKVGGDVVFAPVREALAYTIADPRFFEPGTLPAFWFADRRRDREQSWFAQDTMALGAFTASVGIRWDHYALVVTDSAFSPRLGLAWSAPGNNVVLRASYDRVFQTPAVENLLLASSPAVDVVGDAVRLPVRPSRGNFVEGGLTAGVGGKARLDATVYRRSLAQFADDDVFLNTGVSFPVAFDGATIRGLDAKLTLVPWGRVSAFASYSLLKGTARLPVVGGLFLGEEALAALEEEGDVPITQDQRHTLRGQLRVDITPRVWATAAFRYGSGLPVELEGEVDEADMAEQHDPAVLEQVDVARGRVRPNATIDGGLGVAVWRHGSRQATLRVEAANLADRLNVINFAGVFSGTAIGPGRSVTARLQVFF
jgi:hypothetical protein